MLNFRIPKHLRKQIKKDRTVVNKKYFKKQRKEYIRIWYTAFLPQTHEFIRQEEVYDNSNTQHSNWH